MRSSRTLADCSSKSANFGRSAANLRTHRVATRDKGDEAQNCDRHEVLRSHPVVTRSRIAMARMSENGGRGEHAAQGTEKKA